MRLNFLEIVIGAVLVAGLTWIATRYSMRRDPNDVVPLSPEVKSYIESRTSNLANDQCADLPKLVAKLADLETKLGHAEGFRISYSAMFDRANRLWAQVDNIKNMNRKVMARFRADEVRRMRAGVANVCIQANAGKQKNAARKGQPKAKDKGPKPAPANEPSILKNLPTETEAPAEETK